MQGIVRISKLWVQIFGFDAKTIVNNLTVQNELFSKSEGTKLVLL